MSSQSTEEDTLQQRAFRAFGPKTQLLALAEELNEAAAAVVRLLNDKGDHGDVVEELVDVESVTASLRDYLATSQAWAEVRERKAAKLAAVLERGHVRTRGRMEGANDG